MKRIHIATKRLTTEELAILEEVMKDPFFFSKFIYLIHPIRGKVRFDLYPFQKSVLLAFIQKRFNIILKFRQAGITELIAMFCLWYAMYHPFKNVVIISIKDRVAKKVLRKIKFMYKNLPDYLKVRIVNGKSEDSYGTASDMEFANGSVISSIPTTEEAGRSEAVSLMVVDEAAIVRWIEKIWAASWPTLSTGGRAIMNSTPYGIGNLFHKTYVNACAGGNDFNPINLKWQMHPERDIHWYNQQREILGARKTAQEIDGDFLTSGNTVFDLADIRAIEDYIDNEVIPLDIRENGQLKIYKAFDPKRRFTLGADIATGRANDYTAFSLMDDLGEEYVSFKGKIPLKKAEKLIGGYGKKYHAVVAPESNDIGLGLASNLQDNGYPWLYYSKTLLRKKGKNKPEEDEIPGWYTTKKNRPIIINELEEDISNDTIIIKDKQFCQEAYTFIYDSRNRPVALNKDNKNSDDPLDDDQVYTDDDIFSKAIANFVRKQKIRTASALPR